MRATSKGFTLVEILVVITIITLLAAIIFPALGTAKAKSRQTQCANNIRQIVTAALNYADDWSNHLPGLNAFGDLQDDRFAISSNQPGPSVGKGSLWSYLKTRAIFVCPEDLQHRKPADMSIARGLGGFNYTYTVNDYMTLASVDRKLANVAGPALTKSANPTRTILLVDENTDPNKGLCTVNDAHFASGDSACDRHPDIAQGNANVGYLDGHIGTVPGLLRWDSLEGRKIFLR